MLPLPSILNPWPRPQGVSHQGGLQSPIFNRSPSSHYILDQWRLASHPNDKWLLTNLKSPIRSLISDLRLLTSLPRLPRKEERLYWGEIHKSDKWSAFHWGDFRPPTSDLRPPTSAPWSPTLPLPSCFYPQYTTLGTLDTSNFFVPAP